MIVGDRLDRAEGADRDVSDDHSDDPAYTRPAPAGPGVGWLRRLGPFFGRYRRTIYATFAFRC